MHICIVLSKSMRRSNKPQAVENTFNDDKMGFDNRMAILIGNLDPYQQRTLALLSLLKLKSFPQ